MAGTRAIWDGEGDRRDAARAVAWDMFREVADALPGPSTMNVRSTYYRQGFASDDGSYAVLYEGIGRAAGGVMLTLRQSGLERLGGAGGLALTRQVARGLHISRLDLAADAPATVTASPSRLFAMLPAARLRSRPGSHVLTVDRAGGEKLTIGSRASGRYLRIYAKGERVRHELELKQDVAGVAMAELQAGVALVDVWAAEYGRTVQWR